MFVAVSFSFSSTFLFDISGTGSGGDRETLDGEDELVFFEELIFGDLIKILIFVSVLSPSLAPCFFSEGAGDTGDCGGGIGD